MFSVIVGHTEVGESVNPFVASHSLLHEHLLLTEKIRLDKSKKLNRIYFMVS